MVYIEWVNANTAYPGTYGIKITKDDGATLIVKENDCITFGNKKKMVRCTEISFSGRAIAFFSLFGTANPPHRIMYAVSKNNDGRYPVTRGKINMSNIKLINSIQVVKCSKNMPPESHRAD